MKKYYKGLKIGITGKVVASMFLVVLSIMLLIASYTYNESEKLMRNQIERELSSEMENVENEVTSLFKQKGEIIRQLSIIPVVKQIAEDNESRELIRSSQHYDWLQQALNKTKENNKNIELIWFANLEHSYFVANDDYLSDSTFNVESRAWYPNAQQNEELSFSPPYIDFATKKWTVSITHPIFNENKRLGYIGVDIHLDELPTVLQRFEKNGRHIILVFDDHQTLYDKQNMWSTLKQGNLEEDKVLPIGSSKEMYYTAFRQVNDIGWKIAIYVPEDIFLEPLSKYQSSLTIFWIVALIILLTILSIVLRYLLRDIPLITNQLEKMEHGDFDINIGIKRKDEVGEIAYAVDQMAKKIQLQMEEMNNHAHFDSLTKLPNRNSIEKTLEEWICLAEENGQIIAVTFLDLDHFKQVNDSKGHAYGDELLVQVGQRIKELLPNGNFFGRFGGDEFILLSIVKEAEFTKIQHTLQLVHDAFSEDFELYDYTLHISASMGVSVYPKDAQSKKELLANADTALYEAKDNGRNLVYFFNTAMKDTFERQLMLKEGLRTALTNNEFILHYQPQLDLKLGQTTNVEALIRWVHPEWGMISPAEFIPLAESSGQICEIGNWVIDTSLQVVKRLRKKYPHIQHIAINVSAIQLQKVDFVQNLKHALIKHNVSPNLLEIEITESVIITDEKETFLKIKELKDLGIQIALDDFGTGYSSLNYLHMMPIDKLKVDRSFIQDLEGNSLVTSILETIIELGRTLGFEIIAEGVENETQLQLLREMNVDSIQGFYYSRPLDETTLFTFLKTENKYLVQNTLK